MDSDSESVERPKKGRFSEFASGRDVYPQYFSSQTERPNGNDSARLAVGHANDMVSDRKHQDRFMYQKTKEDTEPNSLSYGSHHNNKTSRLRDEIRFLKAQLNEIGKETGLKWSLLKRIEEEIQIN